jgi:Domain of unknown function (DUF5666)
MSSFRHPLRASWLALLAAGVYLLASCGGGVGDQASNTGDGPGGVGSGGTGSYTIGPISGLGSIIVNGVRYDVAHATVRSDDGAEVPRSTLDLGMQVEVSGGAVQPGVGGELSTASAAEVRLSSALVGPVTSAPDALCGCLIVLGQTVRYTDATNMPKDIAAGEVVEVFGPPDLQAETLVATRVQRVTDVARPYKLVGRASGDDVNPSNRTLTVHGPSQPVVLSYGADVELDGVLGDDDRRTVRVWMSRSAGVPALIKLSLDRPLVSDRDEASLSGLVTSALGSGSLAVNGTVVDTSRLRGEELDQAMALGVGQWVRIEGRLLAGVLIVSEVHRSDDDDDEGEHDHEGLIELHGRPSAITPVAADLATMVLRGVTVVYQVSAAPADLATLSCIEVEAERYDASGRLEAIEVKADNSCHDHDDD